MSEFFIRDATDRDIPAINTLFKVEYGEGYPYLMTQFSSSHINLVAVRDGRIVGFARAAPYGVYVHVWELCSLVVELASRQHGIARAFTVERIERLRRMGVKTLVSEAVTCYEDCASQRNLHNFGFKPYGLLPFIHPWIRPEVLGSQPLSLLLMVTNLNGGTGFGSRELFLQPGDREALCLVTEPGALVPPWEARVSTIVDPLVKHGKVVHGIRCADFVDIPLNHSSALKHRRSLRARGYRFAALLPGFTRGESEPMDFLRVYRPPRTDLTFDLVHVTPDLEPLKRYCKEEFITP
ncbi:MAG: GNAT family N-acetyltransferase [Patescibacteria group bacterium]